MTMEMKAELQERIERAGARVIGRIWPELFLTENKGGFLTFLSRCNLASTGPSLQLDVLFSRMAPHPTGKPILECVCPTTFYFN